VARYLGAGEPITDVATLAFTVVASRGVDADGVAAAAAVVQFTLVHVN